MSRIERKSRAEIAILHRANQIVLETIARVGEMIAPGVRTRDLDSEAERAIRKAGAIPAFKGYNGFPASLCISVNQEVVHGIPGDRAIVEGDIVSIDCGAEIDGFVGDAAATFPVENVDSVALDLIETTRRSLLQGIEAMRPGGRLSDIGASIQACVEARGFSVVRQFVGHGIGRKMHEPPQVANFGKPGFGPLLRPGLVLAIEPMVNIGAPEVHVLDDGWTVVTADGSSSAHFEYSVALTEEGPVILGVDSGAVD